MGLFKILKGDSSRIAMETTPFHEGYAYYCADNDKFYVDSETDGVQKRACINPDADFSYENAADPAVTNMPGALDSLYSILTEISDMLEEI